MEQLSSVYVHAFLVGVEITGFAFWIFIILCLSNSIQFDLCFLTGCTQNIACRLDLVKTADLRVKVRSYREFELLSLTTVLVISWSMIIVHVLLSSWRTVCYVCHIGHVLISSLVWGRRYCPRKWEMLGNRNLIACSLLSHKKIEIFEMLLSTSCVFKSICLSDVVYSESKLSMSLNTLSGLSSSEDFNAEASNCFSFKGAHRRAHIAQQHVGAIAQLRCFEFHAEYASKRPSACLRSCPYVCSLYRVAMKQLYWTTTVVQMQSA